MTGKPAKKTIKKTKWLNLILVVTLAPLIIVASAGIWAYQTIKTPLAITEPVIFTIKSGQSLTSVVNQLAQQKLLNANPRLFVLYNRLKKQTHIQYGEYQLQPGLNWLEVYQLFKRGAVIEYGVTLIEGTTISETLKKLHAIPELKQQIEGPFDPQLIALLPENHNHPEGWFFAETYSYRAGDSDLQILSRAHQKMRSELERLWQQRTVGLPYQNQYEALIMASIIEKETGLAQERPEIAGVFVRRLQKNMRLQTDPTVIYGLGDQYQGNLKRSHLKQVNDYNTYVIKGLPVTPIALVGLASLEAAFNPADGNSLYFVAKGDGSHKFSETLEQHNRAVREFQIEKRKTNYQSAPQR